MALVNSNGEMSFWFNGLPFKGIQNDSLDGGEMSFWFNGLPYPYIFPVTTVNISFLSPTERPLFEEKKVIPY